MPSDTVQFGLLTPSDLWRKSVAEKQATLMAVEEAGFSHLYLADHVSFRDGSGNDGFVDVAALSQLHDRLKVMTSIYLLPLRHPLPVARQVQTMDKVASGRFMFGIGIGGEDRHEVEICGVDPATRGQRTDEMLEIIQRLLDGETLDFTGRHFQLQAARLKPALRNPVPIFVGGRSNAALQRAARFGTGWVGVWCSTRRYAEAVTMIAEQAEGFGRDVQWQHGYQPWLGLDSDPNKAREVVKAGMEAFYHVPFEQFERYTPFGTPAQVAESLAPYAEAGCRMFNLKVCTTHVEEEVPLAQELVSEMRKLIG